MFTRRFSGLAFIGLLFAHPPALAHYLWIEPDAARHARLYFGEYQENLREKSGGRLDTVKGPQAWNVDEAGRRRDITVAREADHFDLGPLTDTGAATLVEEAGAEVLDLTAYGQGVVRPMFYARYGGGSAAPAPQLTLDILPDAGSGKRYTVYFKGAPLPKAKVSVYAPNLWLQERRADERGKLDIATPWPGRYVLEVIHVEKTPGTHAGRTFESVRHRATFTIGVDGADAR
jgi:hypothetical protein